MTAPARRLDPKRLVELLRQLHLDGKALTANQNPTTAFVQHVFGVQPFRIGIKQPLHTVVVAAFFIGGQSQDDLPAGVDTRPSAT